MGLEAELGLVLGLEAAAGSDSRRRAAMRDRAAGALKKLALCGAMRQRIVAAGALSLLMPILKVRPAVRFLKPGGMQCTV